MRSYRNKIDIVADILDVVGGNGKKTKIMIRANLSFKLLQKYLAEMVNAELVRFEDDTQLFRLEEKGREFLESYRRYSKRSRITKKRIEDLEARKKVLEELCAGSVS